MYKIYQAGPLFSDAERSWHGKLSERLRAAGHSVVWPGAVSYTHLTLPTN